jgi:serine/threonine-protein kinase
MLPLAALLVFGGGGIGYLFATTVLFPAADAPTDLAGVPDLSGLTLGAAPARLQGSGLALAEVDSVHHPTVAAGSILGQSPLPGQLAIPGDSVSVMVSRGPQERPVPDVMRIRADRALGVLEASGFQVDIDTVDAMTPRGSVVAVIPEAGELAPVPSEVQLVISRGPPMVLVPLLVGRTEMEARVALDSAGLVPGTVLERFRFGLDDGTVIQQEPAAGAELEQGGSVDLVVGRSRGRESDDGTARTPGPSRF